MYLTLLVLQHEFRWHSVRCSLIILPLIESIKKCHMLNDKSHIIFKYQNIDQCIRVSLLYFAVKYLKRRKNRGREGYSSQSHWQNPFGYSYQERRK
jgi:hypothetical protein